MNINEIKGIGPKKSALLNKELGIFTTEDMLGNYPVSYEDRSVIIPIGEIAADGVYFITASVVKIIKNYVYGNKGKMIKILVHDDTGGLEIIFFNASYYDKSFKVGEQYGFYGKVTFGKSGPQMVHPDFEKNSHEIKKEILPVYRTVKGITQKDLRKIAREAVSESININETLPVRILERNNICGRDFALKNIHFPADKKSFAAAKYRIIYEELFLLQTGLFIKGSSRCRTERGIAFSHDNYVGEFINSLNFTLTDAQQRVIREIVLDMESAVPMQRLVQGDVGSGKTVVAAAALYKAAKNGYQGVLMAPTELLADQHYDTFKNFFKNTDVKIGFLVSGISAKEKRETLEALKAGNIDILIGTHAVIQENVIFNKLGIVITDEQHRFGVEQRMKLAAKGNNPDILVMTATPIPRSLAVIIFGDLDISIIDELPPGRKQIITKVVSKKSRSAVYKKIEKLLNEGQQVYAVAPLIADSEAVEAVSAESLYEELCEKYPKYNPALLHGGMNQKEKDYIMQEFSEGKRGILAATVVIEVGINVPNATVMIVENAERFGLAQLHQLRGRVGRGEKQSYCYLITDPKSELGMERAKTIEETADGFVIAEKDLQMRGPGDFFGLRQHGLPQLVMADLVRHIGILNSLRSDVKEMLQEDPSLSLPYNRCVAEGVEKMFGSFENLGI
ncbi:MAG: ATP-dependent DNA helicase RecG [Firmicutes bacterium]|nr:ATP-dependent DNA helicase RecG [Bacillota bacterium]